MSETSVNIQNIYKGRLKRFDDVLSRRVPDRVPVIPNVDTWIYHYAGVSVKEAFLKDSDKIFQTVKFFDENVPVDGIMGTANTFPVKMGQNIGEGVYVVSDEGVQIKGSSGRLMEPQEYALLAENPMKFFANVLIPRRFRSFRDGSGEKKVDIIKQAYKDFCEFGAYNAAANSRIEKELGLPILTMGSNFLAPDIVLDYLRDFVGIAADIRRCPDELAAACVSLTEYVSEMFFDTAGEPGEKVLFSPLHLPTYLRPKDFARIYLPFMQKYLEEMAVKHGYSIYFFMENNWMPYLDMLKDFPEGIKFVGLFESGDLAKIKAELGSRMTVMGGMPIELLRFGTKEQVIEKSKELLDTLAPGGGYIFSTDKSLLSLNDGKPENLIAACEYITLNGKY
ncbi:MAG: uroporphyrinogen decarboxylase family protein [Eubacteriales bacterium]|nr:uroporphyrinogen decarboxylase family protein [Eubacteriales bacterium]